MLNSAIIFNEIFESLQAEKVKAYNDLNRLLNNPSISHAPIDDVKQMIKNIANIESEQELTVFLSNQLNTKDDSQSDNETKEENSENVNNE
jgi:hypothetical protein